MSMHEISAGLKARGRYALAGHLGTACGAVFTNVLITFILMQMVANVFSGTDPFSFVLYEIMSWLVLTFAGILHYGLCRIFMALQYGKQASWSDLFAGFKESTNSILIIEAILTGIETLLLLPANIADMFYLGSYRTAVFAVLYLLGLLASLAVDLTYGLSFYLLLDYPKMAPKKVLKSSAYLMKGNRGVLFWLWISFIPLFLLGALSFLIGDLFVLAYFYSTEAAFYRALTALKAKQA